MDTAARFGNGMAASDTLIFEHTFGYEGTSEISPLGHGIFGCLNNRDELRVK